MCIVIHVISEPTEMFWRLWPLAAASEEPPLKQSISSGQTRPAPLLMSVRWRPELTTEQGREILWRDFLMSGTVGSPPLENGRSAHSDSGTDWCFSLERDLHLSSPWCNWLFSWLVSELLPVCPSRPRRRIWLVSRERPRRKRRNKSRCPFSLCKALSTALW